MHIIRFHIAVHIQPHQVVLNLLFAYSGRNFAFPDSSKRSGDVRSNGCNGLVEYLSFLWVFLPSHFSEKIHSPWPLFDHCTLEFFLVIDIPCQVHFHLQLGFPDPISACPDGIPVFCSGHTSLLPHPVIFLLIPQFNWQVLFSHPRFHPPLLDFSPMVLLLSSHKDVLTDLV